VKRCLIECGVAKSADAIAMSVSDPGKNVNLRIDYISRPMLGNIPDLLIDLLEVAAYVYCADQRCSRGSEMVPRARLVDDAGRTSEWRSKGLRRYQRLTKKAEALIAAVYLAGTNTQAR
jgi:hypothetical protein